MATTCILISNAGRLWRDSLGLLLDPGLFQVCGDVDEASNPDNAPEGQQPRIFLYHLDEQIDAATTWIYDTRRRFPDAFIVTLDAHLRTEFLARAMTAGAHGYLVEDISGRALERSLQLVLAGEKVFPTALAEHLTRDRVMLPPAAPPAAPAGSGKISTREHDILQHLLRGESNKVIANRLSISEGTVKVHVKRLLKKLNAVNRTQAAMWAVRNGVNSKDEHMPAA